MNKMSGNSTNNESTSEYGVWELDSPSPVPLSDSETINSDGVHPAVVSSDSSPSLATKPSTPSPNGQNCIIAPLAMSPSGNNLSYQRVSLENYNPPAVNSNVRSLSTHSASIPGASTLTRNASTRSACPDSKSTMATDHRRKRIPLRSIQSPSQENFKVKSSSSTFQSNYSCVGVSEQEADNSMSSKRRRSLDACVGDTEETVDDADIWPYFPHSPKSASYFNEISNASLAQKTSFPISRVSINYAIKEKFIKKIVVNDDDEDWPNFPASPPSNKTADNANPAELLQHNEINLNSLKHVDSKTIGTIPSEAPSCSYTAALKNDSSKKVASLHRMECNSVESIILKSNHVSSPHSSNIPRSESNSSECLPSTSASSWREEVLSSMKEAMRKDEPTPAEKSACDEENTLGDSSLDLHQKPSTLGNPQKLFFAAAVDEWLQDNLEDEKELLKRERELVAAGVDPRRRDDAGATPAHLAAKRGCSTTLAALLRLGADPNAKDTFDWRPMHYAARYNHSSCVALLTAQGAHVEARNSAGKTPLHVAAASCAREATRALLAAGANNRARDENGTTPLDIAHSAELRRERLLGRLSGRFLSKKGFGHWTNWRNLLEKERKIRRMLDYVLEEW